MVEFRFPLQGTQIVLFQTQLLTLSTVSKKESNILKRKTTLHIKTSLLIMK